jgi:hypothetical protein
MRKIGLFFLSNFSKNQESPVTNWIFTVAFLLSDLVIGLSIEKPTFTGKQFF